MKTSLTKVVSIVLGSYLILYALNQFFHFLPTGYGKMPDFTRDYLDAIYMFLPVLYIFEILVGLMFVLNKWIPFMSLVLAPLSVNFLIFNFANGGLNILSAAFVAILNLILLFQFRDKFKPLFN